MKGILQALCAAFSLAGLALSIYVHACSLGGTPIEVTKQQFFALHLWSMLSTATLLVAMRLYFRRRPTFQDLLGAVPGWSSTVLALLFVYGLGSAMYSPPNVQKGVADVRNGRYVLLNRGYPPHEITRAEYDAARTSNLRRFSSVWIFFLAVPTVYFSLAFRQR